MRIQKSMPAKLTNTHKSSRSSKMRAAGRPVLSLGAVQPALHQQVANAAHRADRRAMWPRLRELAAQPADGDLDPVLVEVEVVAAQRLHQLPAAGRIGCAAPQGLQ